MFVQAWFLGNCISAKIHLQAGSHNWINVEKWNFGCMAVKGEKWPLQFFQVLPNHFWTGGCSKKKEQLVGCGSSFFISFVEEAKVELTSFAHRTREKKQFY